MVSLCVNLIKADWLANTCGGTLKAKGCGLLNTPFWKIIWQIITKEQQPSIIFVWWLMNDHVMKKIFSEIIILEGTLPENAWTSNLFKNKMCIFVLHYNLSKGNLIEKSISVRVSNHFLSHNRNLQINSFLGPTSPWNRQERCMHLWLVWHDVNQLRTKTCLRQNSRGQLTDVIT